MFGKCPPWPWTGAAAAAAAGAAAMAAAVVVVACLAPLMVGYAPLADFSSESQHTGMLIDGCLSVREVEVIQWPAGARGGDQTLSEAERLFVSELLDKQEPCIIKGCDFGGEDGRGWKQWTPELLLREGPFMAAGVHVGKEERFVYYNRGTAMKEMVLNSSLIHGIGKDGQRASVPPGPDYSTHSMPLQDVLQAALTHDTEPNSVRETHPPKDSYLYWSSEIGSVGPKLSRDIRRALSAFVMPSDGALELAKELLGDEEGKREAAGEHFNAWIGEEGVTASLHYDTSHNFYFQQYGEKQFLLFPPERVWDVYLGPALHPHYRRSQVGARVHAAYIPPCTATQREEKTLFEDWPLLDIEGGQVAVLSPGDVLYLPPYWLHHVTAVSYSVSVNVWHNSEQYWEAEAAAASPIPLESNWTEDQFVCGALAFLGKAMETLTHRKDARALRDSWPRLRHSRVVKESSLGDCDMEEPSLTGLFLARLLHSRYEPALGVVPSDSPVSRRWRDMVTQCSLIDDWGEEPLEMRLERGVDGLGKHFLGESLTPAVRGLVMSNYVEALLNAFVGVQHVQPLLQEWMAYELCQ